jgi:hypothetical protein
MLADFSVVYLCSHLRQLRAGQRCGRMGKEDRLVKIALVPTLVVIGWVGLMADVRAVAQNAGVTVPEAPAAVQVPNGVAPAPNPAMTATPPAAMPGNPPAAMPGNPAAVPGIEQTVIDPTAMDNGLWEGAAIGPGCSKCGGGYACPPEWYTEQGVRILSRSNLRKSGISFQTPKTGVYQAELDITTPGTYQVKNLDVTTANSVLTNSGNVANPYQALNTKQLSLGIAPGYDMTIGHYLFRDRNNNDHFMEFSFWGLNSWSASRVIDGYKIPVYDEDVAAGYTSDEATAINNGTLTPEVTGFEVGSLRTPFPTPRELTTMTAAQKTLSVAFNNAVEQVFSYRSTMNNFELNGRFTPRGQPDRLVLNPNGRWQRLCQPGTFMSYLYGLRFMQIDETFAFHTEGEGQWGDNWLDDPTRAAGDYNVVTHNSLLGLQVGADMTFRKCRWAWGLQSKLGPYVNFANQISTINATMLDTVRDPYDQRMVKNRYAAALIGEVGLQASYKFRPNLVGKASYDFMWITGLALAPEQLQLVAEPTDRINTAGMIFSQGVKLGLEWMW